MSKTAGASVWQTRKRGARASGLAFDEYTTGRLALDVSGDLVLSEHTTDRLAVDDSGSGPSMVMVGKAIKAV